MARINEKLVYPQNDLFIRRNPEKVSEWQVVNGSWEVTDGKRSGFNLSKVLETGISSGKLARERATAISLDMKTALTA